MSASTLPITNLYMDITRLLEHATRHMPAGIDRTEYEYARYLFNQHKFRVHFVFCHPIRGICLLKRDFVGKFLRLIYLYWTTSSPILNQLRLLRGRLYFHKTFSHETPDTDGSTGGRNYYLLLSHHHLTRQRVIASFLKRYHAQFVVMIHDLIPILFPEYSGPREEGRHRRRLKTVQNLKAHVITPSQAVRRDLTPYLKNGMQAKAIMHGIQQPICPQKTAKPARPTPKSPYFVYISTIEPRKNHLLLLNVWRRMVKTLPHERIPELLLIGRRGWENENVIDMLDRCPSIQNYVFEYNHLDDGEVTTLLKGSHGLLFPSFTEGFGLPLAEALLTDTPAVCSNLPVFTEIAGQAAFYRDPLDGPAWQATILALSQSRKRRGLNTLFPDVQRPPLHSWPHQIEKTISWLQTIHN